MERKRCARIVMTNEARVLRQMRLELGYSMRKAGELMGLSDSYIAHLETGRLDVPKGEKLDRILNVYGGIKAKSFYERARNLRETITSLDELLDVAKRLPESKIRLILDILKTI